jgi:hypothetical protein
MWIRVWVTKSRLRNWVKADISLLLGLEAFSSAVLWIRIRVDFGRLDPDPHKWKKVKKFHGGLDRN